MTSEPTGPRHPAVASAKVRTVLPRAAELIEAFGGDAADRSDHVILSAATTLASAHQRQWDAEDAARTPNASAASVARYKRRIDALNADRVATVDRVDTYIESHLTRCADAALHTETLGSVVDRLAIAWVRVQNLRRDPRQRDRARIALRQLTELGQAYDDLVRDIAACRRRLPLWRVLKTYRSSM